MGGESPESSGESPQGGSSYNYGQDYSRSSSGTNSGGNTGSGYSHQHNANTGRDTGKAHQGSGDDNSYNRGGAGNSGGKGSTNSHWQDTTAGQGAGAKRTPTGSIELVEDTKAIYKIRIPTKIGGTFFDERTVLFPASYFQDPTGTSTAVDTLRNQHNVAVSRIKSQGNPWVPDGTYIALNFALSKTCSVQEGIAFGKAVEASIGGAYNGPFSSPLAPKGFDLVNGTREVFYTRDKLYIPRKYFAAADWTALAKISNDVTFATGNEAGLSGNNRENEDYVAIRRVTSPVSNIPPLESLAKKMEHVHFHSIRTSRSLEV